MGVHLPRPRTERQCKACTRQDKGIHKVPSEDLAIIDLPIAFGVESHLEEAILGVVTLAASGADEISAPTCSLPVEVLCDGKSCAATAGDEEHAEGSF